VFYQWVFGMKFDDLDEDKLIELLPKPLAIIGLVLGVIAGFSYGGIGGALLLGLLGGLIGAAVGFMIAVTMIPAIGIFTLIVIPILIIIGFFFLVLYLWGVGK
jgi:hypothetical protein